MKKSYMKYIVFDITLLVMLLLNSFILNILGNYYYMALFLLLLLVAFKFIFGIEKDGHRYIKDIILNMIIIYFVSFIIYYILGIFIGFYKTDNFLTFYGIKTFIVPFILMVIIREFLRYQMLSKTEKSSILSIVTCILFILIEVSAYYKSNIFNTSYNTFLFIALTVLPVISKNIACTFIARKVGYKPNIFWVLVSELYLVFLPIAPDTGTYISSLIEFLFPFILMYDVYLFFEKRKKNIPISYMKKRIYIEIPTLAVVVFVLAYFVSGLFRFYAIAIATGSMEPNISVGDVIIVDQHINYKNLKVGDVIAYKYDGVVISHRLCDVVIVGDKYYFYTKGDANEEKDNYIIFPETILGRVDVKIPYIGLPTIWINRILDK